MNTPTAWPEYYVGLLDWLHTHLLPRTYVEIGVETGRTMSLVLPGTRAIGIDPKIALQYRVPHDAKLYRMTSDEFFAENHPSGLFDGSSVDIALIDGLHLFEVALRDFMNLERFSSPASVILIHDCFPASEEQTSREEVPGCWTGDVWKLILCLKEYRPDLHLSTIDVAPSGLGIVRGLDQRSTVLADNYEAIVHRYLSLPYPGTNGLATVVNLVPNNFQQVLSLLPTLPFRAEDPRWLARRRSLRLPNLEAFPWICRRTVMGSAMGRPLKEAKRRLRGRTQALPSDRTDSANLSAPEQRLD